VDEDFITIDHDFDNAIIGIYNDGKPDSVNRVAYSKYKIIQILINEFKMQPDGALKHFNLCYFIDWTKLNPIFIDDMCLYE
jgi:hypothetical protein